jgi:hypothetical protein
MYVLATGSVDLTGPKPLGYIVLRLTSMARQKRWPGADERDEFGPLNAIQWGMERRSHSSSDATR